MCCAASRVWTCRIHSRRVPPHTASHALRPGMNRAAASRPPDGADPAGASETEVGVQSFLGCFFEQVEVAVDSPWDGQWGGAGEVAQWGFIA